jgi:hypothetical protein
MEHWLQSFSCDYVRHTIESFYPTVNRWAESAMSYHARNNFSTSLPQIHHCLSGITADSLRPASVRETALGQTKSTRVRRARARQTTGAWTFNQSVSDNRVP